MIGVLAFAAMAVLNIDLSSQDRVSSLLELSRSEDPALRLAATKALFFEGDVRAGSRLMQLVLDTDADVQVEVQLLVIENVDEPALQAWRRSIESEMQSLRTKPLDGEQAETARRRITRLRDLYSECTFQDRRKHIGAIGAYGRSLEPGPQFVRVFRALLKHVDLPWLMILSQPVCGTISGTSYDSTDDIVHMYRKSRRTIDSAIWGGWNDDAAVFTLALAMANEPDSVNLVAGMAENATAVWRANALITLPSVSPQTTAETALPLLIKRIGSVRAAAAVALLAVNPEKYFEPVKVALASDGEAARTYFELAAWQYGSYSGHEKYVSWQVPKIDPHELAALAEMCAVEHEAYYAIYVIRMALGKNALPILKRLRSQVSENLKEPVERYIKELDNGSRN